MTKWLLLALTLAGEPQWPAACDGIHVLHGGRTVHDTCLIVVLTEDDADGGAPEEDGPERRRPAGWPGGVPPPTVPLCEERELAVWTPRPILLQWHCLKP